MTTPADLLALARELVAKESETDWRSAASRAYYAAFHACVAWHGKLPVPGSVGSAVGSHEQLIQQLRNPAKECNADFQKRSKWLSMQLSSLKAIRVEADYQLTVVMTRDRAQTACELASQIVGHPPP